MSVSARRGALACVTVLVGAAAAAEPAQTAGLRDGPTGYSVACALSDQPGLKSCADLPAAQACAHEPDYASRPSREPTGMTFVNRSTRALEVYWLDFQGNRRPYRNLAPGGRFHQNTFIGHNWLVATLDGRCLGIFRAAPESLAFF
jgi:hypothetical protein